MNLFVKFDENESGRDFFVGDIHGHYSELMRLLEQRHFNFDQDRLFSVGDIIDRGPENEQCIDLLNKHWFFACLGNHEWLMIGGILYADAMDLALQRQHGGLWMDDHDHDQLTEWAQLIQSTCPAAMEIDSGKSTIGVTHNIVAGDNWSVMKKLKLAQLDSCLWNRNRFYAAQSGAQVDPIKNVDLVISGHNACVEVVQAANQIYIDTLWLGERLTVLSAEEALAFK
ncbi:diadenosine tetraphosphatase-like protein [Oleiphilus messinensis]|uniref:Diadenosine tetraphosphatase-like protein n=1 Tax=Oleiphilus messinensis TaxID=141451 RepID=A0A1Y0IB28_9GAMM|nr:metallophosphoesterase [Oleiphilus messinensis]ARU56675.1 diadenosine tetraphosphatase-like protein [Oleiphilus messinensis]